MNMDQDPSQMQVPLQSHTVIKDTPPSSMSFRQNVYYEQQNNVENFHVMFERNKLRIEEDGKRITFVSMFFMFVFIVIFMRLVVRFFSRNIYRMRNLRYNQGGYYERVNTSSGNEVDGNIPLLPVTAHNVVVADNIYAFYPDNVSNNVNEVFKREEMKITVNGQVHILDAPHPGSLMYFC